MDDRIMQRRLDFQARLRLLSALHVGSGERKSVIATDAEDGPTQVALILRDGDGRPCIPASSLKGVLRSLSDRATTDILFGAITDHRAADGSGQMGALLFRAATLERAGDPIGCAASSDGTFIHQRTAVDSGRGIALRNRLFSKEMVAPGAVFSLRLRLERRCTGAEFRDLSEAVLDLLSAFGRSKGVALGASSADGNGRLRLESEISCEPWSTDPATGALRPGKISVVPARRVAECRPFARLRCHSAMPFLIADSAHVRDRSDENAPHIKALRRGTGSGAAPFVTGSSVSGALRARAEWLARLAADPAGWGMAEPAETRRQGLDLESLSPVEWLFGAVGLRGRLSVTVSEAKGRPAMVTSVKIDRFSGAPIENALFATDGDLGTSFEIVLSLEDPGPAGPLAEALKADLVKNGLRLGHGTNRGFGWFKVEEIIDGRA